VPSWCPFLMQVNTRQQTERSAKAGNIAVDEEDALAFAKAFPTKLRTGALHEIWEVGTCLHHGELFSSIVA
jgi:hypothetical protein